MTVLLGSTNIVPQPASRFGLSVVWTGWNGSVWDLSDYAEQRVGLLANGVTGLLWPEVTSQVTTSPSIDGQRVQGVSVMPRPVVLPLLIRGDGSDDFLALFSAFMRSWSPLRTGVLTISAGSTTRRIRLRMVPDGSGQLDRDPVFGRQVLVSILAVADDPYFTGDTIQGDWSGEGEVRDFFSTDPSYLFWLSPAQQFGNATMGNPGDVPAWPVWSVSATTGSLSGSITVDGGTVGLPTIAAGKTLLIDTDPARGYADLGYIDGTGAFVKESEADGILDPYDPRPIPVGTDVPVGFALTGPGKVSTTLTARYWLGIGDA